jgi:hypothetical protein
MRRFDYGKGPMYVMIVDRNKYEVYLEEVDASSPVVGVFYNLIIMKLIYFGRDHCWTELFHNE